MSLFRKLQREQHQVKEVKEELQQQEQTEDEEESEDEEISAGRQEDLRRFFTYLKQKQKTEQRIQELSEKKNYYCKACDMGFMSKKQVDKHLEGEEHKLKENEFQHSQYKVTGYSRFQRKRENRKIRMLHDDKDQLKQQKDKKDSKLQQ